MVPCWDYSTCWAQGCWTGLYGEPIMINFRREKVWKVTCCEFRKGWAAGKGHPLLSIGQSLAPGDFHSHPDSWSHTRVCGLYCTLPFAAIISFSFITPPFHPSPNDFFAFFVLQKIIFCSGQYSFPNCLFFNTGLTDNWASLQTWPGVLLLDL